jgi:hypothetical protein
VLRHKTGQALHMLRLSTIFGFMYAVLRLHGILLRSAIGARKSDWRITIA